MPDIDLNLLKVFDALIELRSVTRTADRLGLTQSAVSHALGRLRRMLDDPLFVRGPHGLQPSARAEQIAPGVRTSLQQLRDALAPSDFAPAQAVRSFTVAAGAYFCTLIIPPLLERIRAAAPGISLRLVPLVEDSAGMLDRGEIDLALSSVEPMPARFVVDRLFDEEMVWIIAASNPLAATPFEERLLRELPQVQMMARQPFSALRGQQDDAALLSERSADTPAHVDSAAIVYDSRTAISIVARTDMIARIPRRMAERAVANEGIRLLAPAASDAMIGIAMICHRRNEADAALAWLRGLILAIARA